MNKNSHGSIALLVAMAISAAVALVAGIMMFGGASVAKALNIPISSGSIEQSGSGEENENLDEEPEFIMPDIPLPSFTASTDTTNSPESTAAPDDTAVPDSTASPEITNPPETTKAPETTEIQTPVTDPSEYFSDALFIGDSRTVGFYTYARVEGATYFGRTSMNVYNAFQGGSETGNGSMSLAELLTSRRFGKIYILLGINEIGGSLDNIASTYFRLIETIKAYQPEAKIIIQSNMHVTKAKSDSSPNVFSNSRINTLNQKLAALADNSTVFYMPLEHLFDDDKGSMRAEYSYDGVHLYGKYYYLWHDFIVTNGTKY